MLAAVVMAPTAQAVPVLIDFTADTWSGVDGQSSYTVTYGSVDVTLSTSSGTLTFNDEGPTGDGIGIGNDEISWGEQLDVSFSSGVTILGYSFLDLFHDEGPDSTGEHAEVLFADLGTSYTDVGTALDTTGAYSRTGLLLSGVSGITFSAGIGAFSDFALASILIDFDPAVGAQTTPFSVPEPGMLSLLGLGLLLGGFASRRSRRNAV